MYWIVLRAILFKNGSQRSTFRHSVISTEQTQRLRACLIVFVLTATIIVPRQFQLKAVLATLNGQDSVITAGTGSGKTLCIIIPILLRPGTISMTISPLKRLQATQVTQLKCNNFVHHDMQNYAITGSRIDEIWHTYNLDQ